MKTWYSFETLNGVTGWYVHIANTHRNSMPQKNEIEAKTLAIDIEAGLLQIMPLKDVYKDIFWYMRK